ncbi:MAG: hypothetical protein IID36_14440, partial [Planctomycetes bacterium]|nr:hypothetical protein [Planctomycetota bacterium]
DYPCFVAYVEVIEGIGRLVDLPVFQLPAAWGSVPVGDEEVIPNSEYVIVVERTDEAESPPVSVTTWLWADTNNSGGQVDFDDILCVLEGFAGNFAGACSYFGSDLEGSVPDNGIDFDDVLGALEAFSGAGYFDNPTHVDPCP